MMNGRITTTAYFIEQYLLQALTDVNGRDPWGHGFGFETLLSL
jgi:hypothetical protein